MEKANLLDKDRDDYVKKEIAKLAGKTAHKILATWAIDCAEHVLPYFEEKYYKDNRPRKALESGRLWVKDRMSVSEVRSAAFASHDAARVAEGVASVVARAAGHAAATAHVSRHAIHAANYAAITPRERIWQYKHLLNLRGRRH
jgi:hypothetical protein